MYDIYNMFLDHFVLQHNYTIVKAHNYISLISQEGTADIEFEDGKIIATVEYDDIYHVWEIFPTHADFINTVNKLYNLFYK